MTYILDLNPYIIIPNGTVQIPPNSSTISTDTLPYVLIGQISSVDLYLNATVGSGYDLKYYFIRIDDDNEETRTGWVTSAGVTNFKFKVTLETLVRTVNPSVTKVESIEQSRLGDLGLNGHEGRNLVVHMSHQTYVENMWTEIVDLQSSTAAYDVIRAYDSTLTTVKNTVQTYTRGIYALYAIFPSSTYIILHFAKNGSIEIALSSSRYKSIIEDIIPFNTTTTNRIIGVSELLHSTNELNLPNFDAKFEEFTNEINRLDIIDAEIKDRVETLEENQNFDLINEKYVELLTEVTRISAMNSDLSNRVGNLEERVTTGEIPNLENIRRSQKMLLEQWIRGGRFISTHGFYNTPSASHFSRSRYIAISRDGEVISNQMATNGIEINPPQLITDNYTFNITLSHLGVWRAVQIINNSSVINYDERFVEFVTVVGKVRYWTVTDPLNERFENLIYVTDGMFFHVWKA